MKKGLLIYFILIGNFCWGQIRFQKEYPYNWQNQHYLTIYSAQETNDHGFIITAGETYFNDGFFTMFKTDSLGRAVANHNGGGWDSPEIDGLFVTQTSDGGYIFCVNINGLLGPFKGLVKTDSSFNEIWNLFFE